MNKFFKVCLFIIISWLFVPCFALDLDATVNDAQRTNYSKQTPPAVNQTPVQQTQPVQQVQQPAQQTEVVDIPIEPIKPKIIQDLPKVPNLPSKAKSSTVAPINTMYSGKIPDSNAFIPCNDIKVDRLIIDESVVKSKVAKTKEKAQKTATSKTKQPTYRTALLASGTQIRAINQSKITDSLVEGQTIVFLSTQELYTPYFKIPRNTKFIARVVDSHKPQMTCNGGLVGLRIVSANINGYSQQINGGVIKLKTDNVHFSNLKGEHTYFKTVGKKAKWGHNMYKKMSKTSHNLANKGAGVVIAPFPYLTGCILAAASTVSSPATALLGKGKNLTIPANTTFTIKLYDDARLRY